MKICQKFGGENAFRILLTALVLLLAGLTQGTLGSAANLAAHIPPLPTRRAYNARTPDRDLVGSHGTPEAVGGDHLAEDYAYFEDFEASNGGFTRAGRNNSWQWGAPISGPGNAHSGTNIWATNLSGDYNDDEDSYLISPPVDLSAYTGQIPALSWWQWLRTSCYGWWSRDYASVEVSNDGGNTWQHVYGEVCGSVDAMWTEHIVALSSTYTVNDFRARFRLRSDWRYSDRGFYVDDVAVMLLNDLVSTSETPASTQDVYVKGDYAYVAAGEAGLRVVDVSDPAAPQEVGFYDTPGSAANLFVDGDYAYVADDRAGLRVVDVSDPATPAEVGSYDTPGLASGIFVAGDYAYVADGEAGLQVIDVSDPASPVRIGSYDAPGFVRVMSVVGNYAYVVNQTTGLHIVDISNPTRPRRVGFYDMPGTTLDVFMAGDYAYVAAGEAGLRVIDVSDPTRPVEVSAYEKPASAQDVHVAGGYAFVADDEAGLYLVDISDPATPQEVGVYRWAPARRVFVAGEYAYMVHTDGRLFIIQYSGQTTPTPTVTATPTSTPSPTATSTPTITPTVTPTADQCHDAYEPNDSQGEATLLASGQIIQALICPETDRDIYALDVSTLDPFIIEMTGLEPETDFDMWLYDPDGAPLHGSTNEGNADERIEYIPSRTGHYYLMVFRPEAAPANTGPYTLSYDFAGNHLPEASVYLSLVTKN